MWEYVGNQGGRVYRREAGDLLVLVRESDTAYVVTAFFGGRLGAKHTCIDTLESAFRVGEMYFE